MNQETFTIVLKARDEVLRVLRGIGTTGREASRIAVRAFRGVQATLVALGTAGVRAFRAIRGAAALAARAVRLVTPGLGGLLALFTGLAVITRATADAAAFGRAMAEVSTITDATTGRLASLRQEALDLAAAQGQNERVVAKGVYQAISAGVTDVSEAMGLVTEASTLAVAGLADVSSTVDVLTNIQNAYRLSTEGVRRTADILFATVRQGKTTIQELASSLGPAIPLASQLGVSFEELSAIIATITLRGFTTAEAATQVAAGLRALLKNAKDVDGVLRTVGSTFDDNTIRIRGLAPVLEDLRKGLGGSESALVEFLGRAEAANLVLNVTGENLETLNAILEGNVDSVGEAGRAYERLLREPAVRAGIAMNALRIEIQEVGRQVIIAALDAIKLGGGLDKVRDTARAAATVFGEFVGAGIRGVGHLLEAVNRFVDEMGGVDRVADVAVQAVRVFGEAALVTFDLLQRELFRLIGVARELPNVFRAIGAALPGGRATRGEVLEGIEAIERSILGLMRELHREEQIAAARGQPYTTATTLITQKLEEQKAKLKELVQDLETAPTGVEAALERLAAAAEQSSSNVTVSLDGVRREYARLLVELRGGIEDVGAAGAGPLQGLAVFAGRIAEHFSAASIRATVSDAALQRAVEVAEATVRAFFQTRGRLRVEAPLEIEPVAGDSLAFLREASRIASSMQLSGQQQIDLIRATAPLREASIRALREEDGLLQSQVETLIMLSRLADEAAVKRIMQDITRATREANLELRQLGESMGQGLTRQLGGVIARTRDTSEAWRQMLTTMAEDAATLLSRNLLRDLIGDTDLGDFLGLRSVEKEMAASATSASTILISSAEAEAAIRVASAEAAAAILLGSAGGSFFASGAGAAILGGAKGGVFPPLGNLSGLPFRSLSRGDVLREPTIALIREAGRNEAVVPLPDNRSIPVKMLNGGAGTTIVDQRQYWSVEAIDTRSFDERLRERSRTIGGIVRTELDSDPAGLRAQVQRIGRSR